MSTSCAGNFVKQLVTVVNIIYLVCLGKIVYVHIIKKEINFNKMFFQIIGIVLLSIGIQVFKINSTFRESLLENFDSGALLVVALGVCVILVAVIGCVGACFKSIALLDLYVIIWLTILVLNVIAICSGMMRTDDLEKNFDNGSNCTIIKITKKLTKKSFSFSILGIRKGIANFTNNKKLAYFLQLSQSTLHCCGWENVDDYRGSGFNGSVPSSCCKKNDYTISNPITTCPVTEVKSTGFLVGCKSSPVIQNISNNFNCIKVALCTIQVLVLFSICWLTRNIMTNY